MVMKVMIIMKMTKTMFLLPSLSFYLQKQLQVLPNVVKSDIKNKEKRKIAYRLSCLFDFLINTIPWLLFTHGREGSHMTEK